MRYGVDAKRLEEIRARCEAKASRIGFDSLDAHRAFDDREELLAEVDRLRAEVSRLERAERERLIDAEDDSGRPD